MLILRVVFTILSAVCLGALVPLFVVNWHYAVLSGAGAFLFFILMLICKQEQESREAKKAKDDNTPDFLSKTPKKED